MTRKLRIETSLTIAGDIFVVLNECIAGPYMETVLYYNNHYAILFAILLYGNKPELLDDYKDREDNEDR